MEQQKDIYCELGFWRRLSSQFSTIQMSPDPIKREHNQILMDWYDLLCRSNMYFDCKAEDFENVAKNDEYLKRIWKRSTDSRGQLFFSYGAVASMRAGSSEMERKMYNSLYLSDENLAIQAQNVGVINVSSDGILNHTELFNDKGPSITRNSLNDWTRILNTAKAQQNCNSMIIADNYIFKDVKANLYKILDTLLPQKLEAVFYLTVFSINEASDNELDKRRKNNLEKKIKEMRPNLSIVIEVFGNSTVDFHDRGIITNYLWIEIGAGFNLLKSNGTSVKSTNLHITYPMIIPENRMRCSKSGYWNIIHDAQACLKSRDLSSNNRLLR